MVFYLFTNGKKHTKAPKVLQNLPEINPENGPEILVKNMCKTCPRHT